MYVLALHSTTELICFKFASGCGQVPFLNLPDFIELYIIYGKGNEAKA